MREHKWKIPIPRRNEMATSTLPQTESLKSQPVEAPSKADWTQPHAMAIPKEGYFNLQNGRYGPVYPRTPACYGFTIIAKIKPGREDAIRAYGKTIEKAIADLPDALATLKLHYLRWVLFDLGKDTYFMYQGIFDNGAEIGPNTVAIDSRQGHSGESSCCGRSVPHTLMYVEP